MPAAPLPSDEATRLQLVHSLELLDTSPEGEFDDLARVAAALMEVPIALVSVIDANRQWFKAKVGLDLCETSREVSFCAHTILQAEPLVVPDAARDLRFADNSLVTGDAGVRFYCGAPIVVEGLPIGTLCVIDRSPRIPSERQIDALAALGRQAGALVAARGAAERARGAEKKAREIEQMLRAAAEASFDTFIVLSPIRDGQAVVDFRFDYMNDQAAAFFGTSQESLISQPLVGTFPTDNCRRFLGIFERTLRTGESYETEYVSQMPAMEGRWARMKVARAGDRIALTGQDVHDRREGERALAAAKARLSATFDAVQVGIMVISQDGFVLRANPEAERSLGIEAGETRFIGSRTAFETLRLDGSELPTSERPVAGALKGEPVRGTMMRLRWPSGREMCIHANAVPLWNEGEETPYAAVCSFLDITAEVEQRRQLDDRFAETAETNILLEAQRYQLEVANERLAALATTDGLTGLLNHRAFQERLDIEILAAQRTGAPVSLLLLDVDRFKSYNDDFGHPAGDAVLRKVASVLSETCRVGDVIARYGGEEFVAILPNSDEAAAVAVAERLRRALEEAEWPDRAVTASFGATTLARGVDRENLIEVADRGLYESKRGGRNRVTLARASLAPSPLS